jgi:hypothetical protein
VIVNGHESHHNDMPGFTDHTGRATARRLAHNQPLNLRRLLRRLRRIVLFLALSATVVWGVLTYRADHHTFAWDRTVTVAVFALVDTGGSEETADEGFIARFLSRSAMPHENLQEVEAWFEREARRWRPGAGAGPFFELDVFGPLRAAEPPPDVPSDDESFLVRLRQTKGFLDYFEARAEDAGVPRSSYDLVLCLYFYDFHDARRRAVFADYHSVASRRTRLGVVFAPISRSLLGNTCALVAHELGHLLGASDKYRGSASVFPEGFVEPERQPCYPQLKAEIMALGRPLEPGKDEPIFSLEECVVGEVSAREMNWIGE